MPLDALGITLARITASTIMREAVIIAAPEMPILDAARLMLTQKISGVPVLEHGALVGIITESDPLRAMLAGHIGATAVVPRTAPDPNRAPRITV